MSKPKKVQIRNSTAEFLVFTTQAGEKGIEVRVEDQTVWLTQKLIGVLFDKGRSTITEHLQNIFAKGELDEKAVCRDFRHTAEDGKEYLTAFYNLDAIIAVGFRVNSARATQFRQWAIGILPRPEGDYISLTDMVRNFDGAGALIEQWLKNKDTVLFLGVWERIKNPHFNSPEFEGIRYSGPL